MNVIRFMAQRSPSVIEENSRAVKYSASPPHSLIDSVLRSTNDGHRVFQASDTQGSRRVTGSAAGTSGGRTPGTAPVELTVADVVDRVCTVSGTNGAGIPKTVLWIVPGPAAWVDDARDAGGGSRSCAAADPCGAGTIRTA
jgi:hypothetical protein